MIAHFRIKMPYKIHLPKGDRREHRFRFQSLNEVRLAFFQIKDSFVGAVEGAEQMAALLPSRDEDLETDGLKVNDLAAVGFDGLQIKFGVDDTVRGEDGLKILVEKLDQDIQKTFEELRCFVGIPTLRPFSLSETDFLVKFEDESGNLIPRDGKVRCHMGSRLRFQFMCLTESTITEFIANNGRANPQVHEILSLDARRIGDQEHGPAAVLAYAAVESQIARVLGILSEGKSDKIFWDWYLENEDFRKQPSTAEKCDLVLKALSGKSLKDRSDLWSLFRELQGVRHSFVHEGRCQVSGRDVPKERVAELVMRSHEILKFLEELLPEDKRLARSRAQIRFGHTFRFPIMPIPNE